MSRPQKDRQGGFSFLICFTIIFASFHTGAGMMVPFSHAAHDFGLTLHIFAMAGIESRTDSRNARIASGAGGV